MRALSLWQPWASLMAIGAKKIETRHWSTEYRGEIAIDAAKKWNLDLRDITLTNPFYQELLKGSPNKAPYEVLDLPKGCIVAVGELVDCVHTDGMYNSMKHRLAHVMTSTEEDFGDYSPGRFGWVFRNVRRLATPIPYRGQQGLWTLESAIVEQINQEVSACLRPRRSSISSTRRFLTTKSLSASAAPVWNGSNVGTAEARAITTISMTAIRFGMTPAISSGAKPARGKADTGSAAGC